MKKIKWFGIGTTSALSIGVVATAAVIQATSSGVVSFNPGTMSAIEDVVSNQDQTEIFSIGEISIPGITDNVKKSKGKGDKGSSAQDDSVISSEDDLTGSTDDVVSPVSGTSPSTVVSSTTPVEEESVVSVVTPVSEVTPTTPDSSSTPSTPVSGGTPSTPVSND